MSVNDTFQVVSTSFCWFSKLLSQSNIKQLHTLFTTVFDWSINNENSFNNLTVSAPCITLNIHYHILL